MDEETQRAIKERFQRLPKVLQDAITSANIAQHLRELATTHKLHLDQWEALENEVMLTLLGLEQVDVLRENIQREIGADEATASALAADISRIVFEPVRQELERGLEHPQAKTKEVSTVETARQEVLANKPEAGSEQPANSVAPSATNRVSPATPPPPPPEGKAERGPASGAYKPGETSSMRKVIEDDPYREPPQ